MLKVGGPCPRLEVTEGSSGGLGDFTIAFVQ